MGEDRIKDRRIRRIFEGTFLVEAERPEAAREVERKLERKTEVLRGRSGQYARRLGESLGQLEPIWQQRDRLQKRDFVLLVAGFLYFISPVDAIPDPLPVVGHADDLVVIAFVLKQVAETLEVLKVKQRLWSRIRNVIDSVFRWLLTTLQVEHYRRAVATVAIGLWGATTAGAIALSVSVAVGGPSKAFMAYSTIVSALVCAWNVSVAFLWYGRFARLPGGMLARIFAATASNLGTREFVAIGVPSVLLISLGMARVLIQ